MAVGGVGSSAAPAAPTSSNVTVNVLLGTTTRDARPVPRGGSGTARSLTFKLGMSAENIGADPATVRLRLTLPRGLKWGPDLPDPSESCTSTPTTADCSPPQPLDVNDFNTRAVGWVWDIEAEVPGSYAVTAALVEVSPADSDPADNAAAVTINVTPALTVGSVTTTPARPKAGSTVSARVAVRLGDQAVTPMAVACSGSIGAKKIAGRGRGGAGVAICSFRTPRVAAGKTLRGVIALTASSGKVSRRFAVRLR